MTKNVAILNTENKIENIIIVNDDYELNQNEIIYDTEVVYIGGDYIDGYFYPPQPFASWTRLEGKWIPPIPYPNEGRYYWDDSIGNWVETLAK